MHDREKMCKVKKGADGAKGESKVREGEIKNRMGK